MSRLSSPASADDPSLGSLGDRNLERLLIALRQAGAGGVTIAELLASGVAAPAQSVYELQVAGHDVARIYLSPAGGPRKVAYRLRVTESPSD